MNFLNPYAKIQNMTSLSRGSLYQLNMPKCVRSYKYKLFALIYNLGNLQSKWSSNWWTQIGIGWLKIVTILESPIILALAISSNSNQLHIKANETIKFVALSIDVNHGFWCFPPETKWKFHCSRWK